MLFIVSRRDAWPLYPKIKTNQKTLFNKIWTDRTRAEWTVEVFYMFKFIASNWLIITIFSVLTLLLDTMTNLFWTGWTAYFLLLSFGQNAQEKLFILNTMNRGDLRTDWPLDTMINQPQLYVNTYHYILILY